MYRELAFQIWSKFSLYCFCCCLREMFGDSWTKILQYLRCQIEVTYICSIGIFSDMEALELQVVSVSSNEFLSYFDFAATLFLFVKLFCLYLLWTLQVSQNVWNTFSLWMNHECHTLSVCVGYYSFPLIFQWTISLISVWLSHKFSVIASEKYTPLCFLLDHSLPLRCVDRHQFSLHFLSGTAPLFLVWISQKYLVKFLDFFWLNTQLCFCLCLMLLFSNILPNAINECIKVLQPWTHFLLYSQNSVGVFWPSFEFLLKQDVFCVICFKLATLY